MPLKINIATSFPDFAKVLKLRHDVYIGEEGKFNNDVDRMVDIYDKEPNPVILMACDGIETVGTMRINTGTIDALPFSAVVPLEKSLEILENPYWVTCTSMLAIRQSRRGIKVLAELVKAALQLWVRDDVDTLVSTVNASTAGMWLKRGFKSAGEPKFIESIDDWVHPLYISIEDLQKWAGKL